MRAALPQDMTWFVGPPAHTEVAPTKPQTYSTNSLSYFKFALTHPEAPTIFRISRISRIFCPPVIGAGIHLLRPEEVVVEEEEELIEI